MLLVKKKVNVMINIFSGKSSLANALLGCDPRGEDCLFGVCEGLDSCTKATTIGTGSWLGRGDMFTVKTMLFVNLRFNF